MSVALAALMLAVPPSIDPAALEEALTAKSLLLISINPESRVKAERGPAAIELRQGESTTVLVKVRNEAGVTAAMAVNGPGLGESGWLDAEFVGKKHLHGDRVQFLLLRLSPRDAGRREATFRFDIGQGTQDLGFRAEVPILFRIRAR